MDGAAPGWFGAAWSSAGSSVVGCEAVLGSRLRVCSLRPVRTSTRSAGAARRPGSRSRSRDAAPRRRCPRLPVSDAQRRHPRRDGAAPCDQARAPGSRPRSGSPAQGIAVARGDDGVCGAGQPRALGRPWSPTRRRCSTAHQEFLTSGGSGCSCRVPRPDDINGPREARDGSRLVGLLAARPQISRTES